MSRVQFFRLKISPCSQFRPSEIHCQPDPIEGNGSLRHVTTRNVFWSFRKATYKVDRVIYVISVLFCYAFGRVSLLMPCGHLFGKGWPISSRLWCLIVKLSLSHWYPGSGVVLVCIDSWSLSSFFLFSSNWPSLKFYHWNLQRKINELLHLSLSTLLVGKWLEQCADRSTWFGKRRKLSKIVINRRLPNI